MGVPRCGLRLGDCWRVLKAGGITGRGMSKAILVKLVNLENAIFPSL